MIKTHLQALRTGAYAVGLAACVALQTTTATADLITNIAMVPWLTIESQVGWTNQIQYSTNLSQTNWTVLTNLVVAQSPYWFFDVGAASTPQRFYRFLAGPNVSQANQAPSFVKGADQTVNEDSGPVVVSGWATAISPGPPNESSQTVTFVITNNNATLFSGQPFVLANGELTYTPAANAYGTATVTLTLKDNGGTANGGVDTSAPQTFVITINPVNHPPSFVKGADQTVNEGSGPVTVIGWATAISPGPANESSQTVSFLVANNNTALFSAQPSVARNGTLTFTPAADADGTATVTVILQDSGGTANGGVDTSSSQTFIITVNPVNQAPSFVKGADQTVAATGGPVTVTGWATAISPGPADESGQTVSFVVTNNNTVLFSAQPEVAANGTLTYTPAANANGTATVTVILKDNGGTANGGVDTSAPQTFSIRVNPVIAVNMAPIDGNNFQMGDSTKTSGDGPLHTVGLTGFFIDTNLVTYALWQQVYQYATAHGYTFDNAGSGKGSSHPVQTVNWYDAAKWCNARSEMDGLAPCYYTTTSFGPLNIYKAGRFDVATNNVDWNATGYRLPTEAEWEKAARGKLTGQRFPWGNTIDQTRADYQSFGIPSYDVGKTQWNPIGVVGGTPCTCPVGSFAANGYGLNDMAGNVAEWCWDWYALNYYSTSPAHDPLGPNTGTSRATRGGSWMDVAPACQCSARTAQSPRFTQNTAGFRCVKR